MDRSFFYLEVQLNYVLFCGQVRSMHYNLELPLLNFKYFILLPSGNSFCVTF